MGQLLTGDEANKIQVDETPEEIAYRCLEEMYIARENEDEEEVERILKYAMQFMKQQVDEVKNLLETR